MPDIARRLGRDMLVIEGAMGTMLQRSGMPPGVCPELLNVTDPETVAEVHRLYVLAGADCVVTNTFGGTRVKLAEHGLADRVEELNRAAVRLARAENPQHVLADVGPTGLVMEPLGAATFDEVFALFAEQIEALVAEDPDAILIETMTDVAEARCAVLAARSVCDLPVFVTCTFGESGRMDLSGTDPETAAVVLEAAGADAVGMNCGLGPEQMFPLLERMARATTLPLVVQPNAGLPRLDASGATVFPGTPDEMAYWAGRFRDIGANLIGSCCGSTPAFTGAIYAEVSGTDVTMRDVRRAGTVVAGPRSTVVIGGEAPVRIVGERVNPTGKKHLADSLREGSLSVARSLAAEQQAAGADLLDVNVGAVGVDAAGMLPRAVLALTATSELPLVIDTTDAVALERALRVYPGKALVNSVNGEPASLETVLPLVKRYGAAVVVLALDEDGIPATAEGRVAVVERIRAAAHELGIADADLVVDTLVMTAATDPAAPRTTLGALEAVSASGLSTILGVSNVSHGLPGRPLLNAAFISAAVAAGLDAAIANPNDTLVVDALRTADADAEASLASALVAWDAAYAAAMESAAAGADALVATAEVSGERPKATEALATAVLRGDTDAAASLVDAVVAEGTAAGSIISTVLTPAIQSLGDAFGRGEVFLPQMMVAAEAMKSAVARVKELLPDTASASEGTVVFCTVKGDIHSIGKDICVSMLESQGFDVVDLGVDVAPEDVLAASAGADVVCLSALMTTTLPAMRDTVELLQGRTGGMPVYVGGAVVTDSWARSIGAGYTADAPSLVEAVRTTISHRNGGAR